MKTISLSSWAGDFNARELRTKNHDMKKLKRKRRRARSFAGKSRRQPMSDKLDWDVALIGFDPTQRARYLHAIIDARQSGRPEPEMDCGRRKTDLVRLIDDDDGRRSFYEALLQIQWLPSVIQGAVMKVLDQALQKHKRCIADARTVTF